MGVGSQSSATRQQGLVGLILGSAGFGVAVAALGDIGVGSRRAGDGQAGSHSGASQSESLAPRLGSSL